MTLMITTSAGKGFGVFGGVAAGTVQEEVTFQDGWGRRPAGFVCRLSLRESTPFRGPKGDFTPTQAHVTRETRNLNHAVAAPALRLILALLSGLIIYGRGPAAGADEFDRLEGSLLFDIPGRAGTGAPAALSFSDLEALPSVLRDERASLVLVKTDQGNLAKILVSAALKKLSPLDDPAAAVPVLILERFETVDAGDRKSFKARGKGVTLFDGFQFDLDTGQVVPDRAGGDIVFAALGAKEPRLSALSSSRLYTLVKPLPPPSPSAGGPSSGRAILPGDFSGRFDLHADGQWSGRLDLAVDSLGAVSGSFRSDKNGVASPVTGKAGDGAPRRIRFDIKFPRAQQSYEGLIWTEGKNVIAGTLSMLDQPYSFVAIRQGTSLSPRSIGLAPAETKGSPP